MRTLTWIVLVGSLLGSAGPADAVLCKTKAGAVVLRDACRAKETTLDMSVVGPGGAPGAPGADGAVGSPPLRLIDATGRVVGPVVMLFWYVQEDADSLPGSTLMHVLIRHDAVGGAAVLGIDYAGQPSGSVFWTGANCTGDAMALGDTFLPVVEVIGSTMFVPGMPMTAPSIGALEQVNTSTGCTSVTPRGGCCLGAGGTLPGARQLTAQSFDVLGIVPPLLPVAP
jgi:hypothetical protein